MRRCVVVVMSGDLGFRGRLSLLLADTNTISEFGLTFEAIAAGVLTAVYVHS
jgi:hypothetical protein